LDGERPHKGKTGTGTGGTPVGTMDGASIGIGATIDTLEGVDCTPMGTDEGTSIGEGTTIGTLEGIDGAPTGMD
jgi:hypothetical protein